VLDKDDNKYYFSDEYLTYRTLVTKEDNWEGYQNNKKRIDSIAYHNDKHYYQLYNNDIEIDDKSKANGWPCLVRFPEQLSYLPDKTLYLVHTNLDYFQQFFVKGVTPDLDIFVREIHDPVVKTYEYAYYDMYTNIIYTPEQLMNIESTKAHYNACVTSDIDDKFAIPLRDCNLLPYAGGTCYSATFYSKDIAEIYSKSVCAFIEGMFARYKCTRRYYC